MTAGACSPFNTTLSTNTSPYDLTNCTFLTKFKLAKLMIQQSTENA